MTRMLTKTFTTTIAGALIAGAGLIALPTTASAAPQGTETVSFTLDGKLLMTEAGVAQAYDILVQKAEAACEEPDGRRLIDRRREEQCKAALIESFIASTGHQGLSIHHVVTTR